MLIFLRKIMFRNSIGKFNVYSDSNFKIAKNETEINDIYALRYKVYVEEMKKNISSVNNLSKFLKDSRDDHSVHFCLCDCNGVYACLTSVVGFMTNFTESEEKSFSLDSFSGYINKEEISISRKLIVDPSRRNLRAAISIIRNARIYAINNGIKIDFCHCYPHLIPFYKKLGYKTYKESIKYDGTNGKTVPLFRLMEDSDKIYYQDVFRISKKIKVG